MNASATSWSAHQVDLHCRGVCSDGDWTVVDGGDGTKPSMVNEHVSCGLFHCNLAQDVVFVVVMDVVIVLDALLKT